LKAVKGKSKKIHIALRAILACVIGVSILTPSVSAANSLEGRWALNITIPRSPGSRETRTFTINIDVTPLQGLVGRMTITHPDNVTVGGAWRQTGKRASITYELPCPGSDGSPCATLVMLGKVKGDRLKKGKVIVMWDTPNDDDPSFFDTSLGAFNGTRLQ
jgi:hypothetical protein